MKPIDPVPFEAVDWTLKQPCADCPFRRTAPDHVGVACSIPVLYKLLTNNRFAHTCHKTDPRSDSPQGQRYTGRFQHCRGALVMLVKTGGGADLQLPLLRAIAAGKLDIAELAAAAAVDTECFTLPEFVEHYAAVLRIDLRRRRNRKHRKELKGGGS